MSINQCWRDGVTAYPWNHSTVSHKTKDWFERVVPQRLFFMIDWIALCDFVFFKVTNYFQWQIKKINKQNKTSQSAQIESNVVNACFSLSTRRPTDWFQTPVYRSCDCNMNVSVTHTPMVTVLSTLLDVFYSALYVPHACMQAARDTRKRCESARDEVEARLHTALYTFIVKINFIILAYKIYKKINENYHS